MRVFITGASRGLGLEFVRQYVQRGDEVFAACRNPDQADQLQALKADNLHIITLEVTDLASIEAAYAAVSAQTDALDVLINNAAIGGGANDRLGSLTFDDLTGRFKINSVAPIMIVQRFRDLVARGTNPKIINITSGNGSLGNKPDGGSYGYSASKAALNMFMRTLSFDLKAITTLVIDPGWVKTDMGGPNAWFTPAESISQVIAVIDGATLEDTGKFLRWDGKEVPW